MSRTRGVEHHFIPSGYSILYQHLSSTKNLLQCLTVDYKVGFISPFLSGLCLNFHSSVCSWVMLKYFVDLVWHENLNSMNWHECWVFKCMNHTRQVICVSQRTGSLCPWPSMIYNKNKLLQECRGYECSVHLVTSFSWLVSLIAWYSVEGLWVSQSNSCCLYRPVLESSFDIQSLQCRTSFPSLC